MDPVESLFLVCVLLTKGSIFCFMYLGKSLEAGETESTAHEQLLPKPVKSCWKQVIWKLNV